VGAPTPAIAAAPASARPVGAAQLLRRGAPVALWYVVLIAGALIFVAPALWMLATSLKTTTQLYQRPNELLPSPISLANYWIAWFGTAPFMLFLRNTLIVTGLSVIGQVASSALVAFAFARLRWSGRDFWFALCLSTMMLPQQVTLIPLFILFTKLGWVNTFLPLTVPAFFGVPFFIFLLRQFFMGLPRELDEAAVIDGASTLEILTRILLPLCLPALAACAIFSFVAHWNDFLNPLLYLRQRDLYTLQLGLLSFYRQAGVQWELMMAASTLIMLPCLILFFLAQRVFVQGIALSGLKG
jgi:ABC-type glycerol-3-phosphate transport system permease component